MARMPRLHDHLCIKQIASEAHNACDFHLVSLESNPKQSTPEKDTRRRQGLLSSNQLGFALSEWLRRGNQRQGLVPALRLWLETSFFGTARSGLPAPKKFGTSKLMGPF